MRAERITLRQAQCAWDAIQKSITLAPYNGAAVSLPAIDMAGIFNGRKTMTHHAVIEAVKKAIDEAIPT